MTRRGRKLLVVTCVIALRRGRVRVVAARKPVPKPVAVPPEVPASVVDPAVCTALTEARDKVLAEPQSGQRWGELGWSFRAHTLNSESNACFVVAAQLDPQNPRWPYLIGVINMLIAPDDVVPHLRTAYELAVEPEHKSLTRLRLAEALLERDDLNGAAKLFAEEARTDPLNPHAQFGLGAVAAARGEHESSGHDAAAPRSRARSRTRRPLPSWPRVTAGWDAPADAERFEHEAARTGDDLSWSDPFLSEYIRRQTGLSAQESRRGVRSERELVRGREGARGGRPDQSGRSGAGQLGDQPRKNGPVRCAERVLRVVVARTPDHAVARYFLGISLYMPAERAWAAGDPEWARPRFEEAIKELREAAKLKPDKGMAHLYAGLALKYLGDLPAALDECREAVRASPHLADTHLGMGEVLVAMGKPAEAVPSLEAAAALLPLDRHPREGAAREDQLQEAVTGSERPIGWEQKRPRVLRGRCSHQFLRSVTSRFPAGARCWGCPR